MSAARKSRQHATRVDLALGLGGVAIFAWSFGGTLVELVRRWSTDPNYGHGFLVPIVSLLIYLSTPAAGEPEMSRRESGIGRALGGAAIVVGMLIHGFTVILPSIFLGATALVLVIVGLARLLSDARTWHRLRAPLAFLVFLIPWPAALYSRIAFPLRQLSSAVAEVLLDTCGVAVARAGNLLLLPGQEMFVAEACSGLRQLVAFLAVGAAVALLARRPLPLRIALFLSAIPLAVAMNIARITLMGLLANAGKVEWTMGIAHDLDGLVMVAGGLAVLWLEVWLFDAIERAPGHGPPRSNRTALEGGVILG